MRDDRLLRLRVTMPDVSGSLARVAGLIAEAGGNIVEVVHQRLFGVLSVRRPEVEFLVETRDREHGQALLAALEDERLGEHACAIVRMLPGAAPVTLGDVTAHLSGVGLARQKWPEELRIVDDFPRTASGKVRKVDLRAWLRAEPGDAHRSAPGGTRVALRRTGAP